MPHVRGMRIVAALIWLTVLVPAPPARGESTRIDPKAEEVLRQFADHLQGLDSFKVRYVCYMRARSGDLRGGGTVLDYKLAVQRPNEFVMRPSKKRKKEGVSILCDGEHVYTHNIAAQQYTVEDAPADLRNIVDFQRLGMLSQDLQTAEFIEILLAEDPYDSLLQGAAECQYVDIEKLRGGKCHHLKITSERGSKHVWIKAGGKPTLERIEPEADDYYAGVMLGSRAVQGADVKLEVTFRKWKTRGKIPQRLFDFKAPRGAEEVEALVFSGSSGYEPLLNEKAPTMELPLHGGGKMKLADHKDKDVVILDFWTTWCGACTMGMPILEEVAAEYKDKSVVLYAVNQRQKGSAVERFLKKRKLNCTVAMDETGALSAKFGVRGIPHTVIIDREGVVRAVYSGLPPDFAASLRANLDRILARKIEKADSKSKPSRGRKKKQSHDRP
jgi:thiol-disulfide isomerase/thioredoxin